MNENTLLQLLQEVRSGGLEPDAALEKLRTLPFTDLDFARVDGHRSIRCGFPEVIYGEEKTVEETVRITQALLEHQSLVLVTRAREEQAKALQQIDSRAFYHERARCITIGDPPTPKNPRTIAIIAAGTSDLAVAEEARITAQMFGHKVETLYDVGVAGLHRLLPELPWLRTMTVSIVVAGMEGALPSVIGGLVSHPIIAVPTSVGYGAAFQGLAALLGMLNSCASGITVVNIDNGFGAGYAASLIARVGLDKNSPQKGS